MESLLQKAGVPGKSSSGFTHLHDLIQDDRRHVTKEHCQKFSDQMSIPWNGMDPLTWAAKKEDLKSFKSLVAFKPSLVNESVAEQVMRTCNPDFIAVVEQKCLRTCPKLIVALASAPGKEQERFRQAWRLWNLSIQDLSPNVVKSAITAAITNGQFRILEMILPLAKPGDLEPVYPMWLAVDKGQDVIAKYLAKQDALYLTQKGPDGTLPEDLARGHKRTELLKQLWPQAAEEHPSEKPIASDVDRRRVRELFDKFPLCDESVYSLPEYPDFHADTQEVTMLDVQKLNVKACLPLEENG